MLSYGFLDVVFSPYNDYWREMHKLFNLELLSMRRVQSFSDARATEVERLIKSIEISPPVTPSSQREAIRTQRCHHRHSGVREDVRVGAVRTEQLPSVNGGDSASPGKLHVQGFLPVAPATT
jgi:hypothetical protein